MKYFLLEKIDECHKNDCRCIILAANNTEARARAVNIFEDLDDPRYTLRITQLTFNEDGIMWV